MNTPSSIVILGGGYAGIAAAIRLSQKTHRLPVTITLVNGRETFIERVRLHQVGGTGPQRSIPALLRGTGVRFLQGWVTRIDPESQQITVKTERGTESLRYDQLLDTLGSVADTERVPGVSEFALAVGNPADAARLHESLPQLAAGSRVVVVGGGLTGIETVSEIAETYPELKVQMVAADVVGAGLSSRGREYIERTFARLNITTRTQTAVKAVEAGAVITASGERIPFDLCIWTASFRAPALARESGFATNERGQVLVDPVLRAVSHANVFAAGDASAFVDAPGVSIRMACATAIPLAVQAADNLAAVLSGQDPQPFGFSYVIQCISLGRHDGLIQFVNPDDTPKDRVLTGRAASWVKEMVCRFAAASATQGWMVRYYTWPNRIQSPASTNLPPLRQTMLDSSHGD
jgi:NADH:ubiquinone reductase (H+-translocating)